MRRNAHMDEDRRVRAAPSPSPLSRGHSFENLPSPLEGDYIVSKMQYLDLDLDCKIPSSSALNIVKNESSTVYKEVDFKKTHAFNITKNILEKERQDTVAFHKKWEVLFVFRWRGLLLYYFCIFAHLTVIFLILLICFWIPVSG